MQWFPVFFALFVCGVGFAEDATFDGGIKKYLTNCKQSMVEKDNLMMAYFYINPHTFGRIPSFDVASFDPNSEPKHEKARSETLLKTACICTNIPMNTYDFIVVPFMFNRTTKDALTMYLFYDDATELNETLDRVEPQHQNRHQGVYENADQCEQSNIGHVGKMSRRCQLVCYGCFHRNGLNDANENVIASCIGRAENYVAARKDVFDRYHEALICPDALSLLLLFDGNQKQLGQMQDGF